MKDRKEHLDIVKAMHRKIAENIASSGKADPADLERLETSLEAALVCTAGLRDRIFFTVEQAEKSLGRGSPFTRQLLDQVLPEVAGEHLLQSLKAVNDALPSLKILLEESLERGDVERAGRICGWIEMADPTSPMLDMAARQIKRNGEKCH